MKAMSVITAIALLCLPSLVIGQNETPEDITRLGIEAFAARDYPTYAQLLDTTSLLKLKEAMSPVFELLQDMLSDTTIADPPGLSAQMRENLMRANSMSPDSFLVFTFEFLSVIVPDLAEAFESLEAEVVCTCYETDSLAHVVTRSSTEVSGVQFQNAMEVVSLRLSEGGWRMTLSAEIMNLAETLRRGLQRGR